MAQLTRIDARVDGFSGGPAINSWYFSRTDFSGQNDAEVNTALANVRAFYDAIKANYPTTLGIQVLSPATVFDPADGQVQGLRGTAVPALVSGTTAAALGPAQVAILCRLLTPVVVDRHVLKGRIYLGPFQVAVPGAGSVPAAGTVNGIQAALSVLVAANTATCSLAVWHRPRRNKVTKVIDRAGSAAVVTAGSVPLKWVTQRRRLPE